MKEGDGEKEEEERGKSRRKSQRVEGEAVLRVDLTRSKKVGVESSRVARKFLFISTKV